MAIASFAPSAVASLVAGQVSSNVLLPTTGSPTIALATNFGNDIAYVLLSIGASTVTPSTGVAILPGASLALTIGSNTYINALSPTTTFLNIAVGS